jgi:predicted oxidoreductase
MTYDAVVVGAGLAGLVATAELTAAGRRVLLLDQETRRGLGGQAYWSFGGLFMVDSPEQRRLGVHDSAELALADWLGSAQFDASDEVGRAWAEGFVEFAAGPMRAWLHGMGVRWFPLVQWAERGGYFPGGHGNSVPRFHVTWGTGPGILEPFVRALLDARAAGLVDVRFRHRVTGLVTTGGRVTGVRGEVLAHDEAARGVPTSREVVGPFEVSAGDVLVATGGIGANHQLVRSLWPSSAGRLPGRMLSGVPDHVDGSGIAVARDAGGAVVHEDRMWHYPEGITDHTPVWSRHGIRILPGPSSLWLDADGNRLPPPLFPGFDALGALTHITGRGDDHSWFVLDKTILGKEFALSGSEQNPDLTGRDIALLLDRLKPGAVGPVEAFASRSPEFLHAATPEALAAAMNALSGTSRIDPAALRATIEARDEQVATGLGKDPQVIATAAARHFVVDRLIRVAEPHRLLDPAHGPLYAVRLSVLTRKTLGGLLTDTQGRVLRPSGEVLPGLWAAGEASGFGGGGVHGHRALEGTFLGGCLFTGRTAGRAMAR